MSDNSTHRQALRKSLLDNGYLPLPLAKKGVFIKNWSRTDITEDWLEQFRRSGRYLNTGLRCDNLLAFDIDVLDEHLANQCEALVELRCGPTEFCRVGQWPKRLLLYRLNGEPERSGRTGKYGEHMCELLATHGRQFVAYGIHPGTKQAYEWLVVDERDGEVISPLTVPWSELPSLTAERARETLEALDDLLASTGLPQARKSHFRALSGLNEYDLTPETVVEFEGERVAWGELQDDLSQEGGFGNLFRPEYGAWGDSSAVHFYRAKGSGQPCAHDFVNDVTHWSALQTTQLTAALPDPPPPEDDPFIHPDIRDLISNCVILRDKTVRRLDAPTRNYPLDGFVRSYQHLQVPDPNPPKNNPNKTIAFTRLWERDGATLKADYAALRPDYPEYDIIKLGAERVLNTYLPPLHTDDTGELDAFMDFIDHLLPVADEGDLFLDWLALKTAHPHYRMHGMVMVTPSYGTGRGTLCQIMGNLFGSEYVSEVKLSQLIGNGSQSQYNSYLADSLLITVSEALEEREDLTKWTARHLAYERLKTVCDPVAQRMYISNKYGKNASADVFASLFISSQHVDALAIAPGDRRLIVLDNTETPLVEASDDLYARIHAWKDIPANIAELHRWLLQRAAQCTYDPFGNPPDTPAKNRMIESGQSDMERLFNLFLAQCKGDIVAPAQWRHFVHASRFSYDLDLPADSNRLDNAISAVLKQHGRRLDNLTSAGIKVKGRPVRPWIIRNARAWRHCVDMKAIREQILLNGDLDGTGNVVALPSRNKERPT